MPKPYSPKRLRWLAQQFCHLESPDDLAGLLGMQPHLLNLLAAQPCYNTFRVPKRNGSYRLIEDPEPHLKQVQKRLNAYLQAVYYLRRTPAAYGFQLAVAGDPDVRNILTNARRHLGQPWMLNADFDDFFHLVTAGWVQRLFHGEAFDFGEDLAHLLTRLTTFNGRLPMGAPTSPVLSNLATVRFDADVADMARTRQWIYTRFADDLTVSASQPFTTHHVEELRRLAQAHGLAFEETKVFVRSPSAEKVVTGLRLTPDGVALPAEFVGEVIHEIERLKKALELHARRGRPVTPWLETAQQQVEGQLAFAAFVLPPDDPGLAHLRTAYALALQTLDSYEPVSWRYVDYA